MRCDEAVPARFNEEPQPNNHTVMHCIQLKVSLSHRAGSISTFHVMDDTDLAGTIPYLPEW
ncbi:MAG: hypothetical protein BMS9Abin05_2051 [Rhodothermia bacterium]|nr:MAG: hypothetical protein BMS9Abin05_2051 [Rhodothermia bacterium]